MYKTNLSLELTLPCPLLRVVFTLQQFPDVSIPRRFYAVSLTAYKRGMSLAIYFKNYVHTMRLLFRVSRYNLPD